MLKPILIDLLRHGEVEGRQHVARGSTDNSLSAWGWQQLMQVKATIGTVDVIATSPLKRCRLFAESCPEPVQVFDDMRELDFGDWENKSSDEVNNQTLLQQFFDNPSDFQAPNGEAFEDFTQRVIQAWECWLQEDVGEHRLLIAHGCVIRVILVHLLGMPSAHIWRLTLDYAAWSRVSCMQGEQPRVLCINQNTGQA
ncbi:MAG: histidine phosphatase family protein [Zetaproteobacteria bacterium]|nr:histidine phosphatase family protein [Zetaproteobacteria bacterium]